LFDNSFESENSLEVKRGRGRPKKERTEEELELMNRPKLSRGRPRKERTPEELEAELNKVSRGRGRPKKERTEEEILALQNKVSRGRGRPRKEVGPTEIDNITEKRGRGRPKKISEELNESENYIANSTKRGRGRPKKYTAIVIQNLKQPNDINDEIKTEEIRQNENTNSNTQSEELVKKVFHEEVISNNEENLSQLNNQQSENNDESENLTNSFAPAQNKYGLGLASLNNVYKTKKVTIRHEEITNSTVTKAEYNFTKTHLNNEEEQPEIEVEKVEQKKENTKDDTKTLKEIMEEDDIEPTEKSSLSENINNILSSGGSIADALKALMEE